MKKLTLGLFSILIAFSFGCNDDEDDMDMEPQFEVVWEESFEDGTGDWITQEDTGALGWCGNIYHRTVDDGNVMPSEGNGYAVAEHDSCNEYYSPFIPGSGPYRAFGEYSDEWPEGGFKGDLDIYLNPTSQHDRLYGNGNQVFYYDVFLVFDGIPLKDFSGRI